MLRVSCDPLGEGSRCKCSKFFVIAKPVRRLVVAISRNNVYFKIPTPVCATFRNDKERLLKTSANVGTPCCRTGFCVRRNKEPICDSQIRWIRASVLPIRRGGTVATVRETDNFLCPKTRPFIRTQKRLNLPQGVNSSVSNVDFFRLTQAAPAYSLCTAIHSERKSRVFMKFDLRFDNTDNP